MQSAYNLTAEFKVQVCFPPTADSQLGKHQRGVQLLHAPPGDKAEKQVASLTWSLSTGWLQPAFYGNVITLSA